MTEQGEGGGSQEGFQVHLDVFEGPFDLLLGLIAKHKLDVTEVALAQVTDEFITYISAHEEQWDLEQATHFLVVAATLLDLKAARLLPSGDVEDEEDLELLEARDLLFARLLQYRAYQQVSSVLSEYMADQSRRFGRSAGPDPAVVSVRPEVRLGVTPQQFAAVAARALTPKPEPTVSVEHIYTPLADVDEQAGILMNWLRWHRQATFRGLVADCAGVFEVVARFLALLDLYRDGAVGFEQVAPLSELYVRWIGTVQQTVASDGDGSGDPNADPSEESRRPADVRDSGGTHE